MSNVYSTLFDSYYLARGIMMLRSLSRHGNENDRIYAFCFDQHTLEVLKKLSIPKVIPVSLEEFETAELIAVKGSRTKGEYCWTCTAHTILHVIEKKGEPECTYLDADLYFYQNPSVAMPAKELVLITEHRYTPRYDQTQTSGRFCVQFVTFKNEDRSMRLLRTWASQCIKWCFNRVQDGKFGDQKYLDVWPNEGSWVKISDHPGLGMAPWNIQQYEEGKIDPIFYHFHGIHWYENNLFFLGPYRLKRWVRKTFYQSYLAEWVKTSEELKQSFNTPVPKSKLPSNPLKYMLKRWIFWPNFIRV